MKARKTVLMIAVLATFSFTASGQTGKDKKPSKSSVDSTATDLVKPQKSVTQGSVTVEGKSINYQAVAGTIVLKDKKDKPTCSMFYAAYFKSGVSDASTRPVTFIYNGGPGSATLWLHMAAWGPQRANAADTARTAAPYHTVNNDYSLLDASDLVFIDAPGTGFSQIIDKDKGGAGDPKDFYGTDEDAAAFTQFITRFLSTYNRWNSPKYLFGESYGTFRSAAVAYQLSVENGVDLNGVILLSQLLNWDNMSDMAALNPGMDLPFQLTLPSLTATAWYHHKLPNQPEKLEPLLKEVEEFAMGDYAKALGKGSALDESARSQIVDKLHNYTGLSEDYIRKANLRISGPLFEKNLLGKDDKLTGRLDSRFSSYAVDPLGKEPIFDPMDAAISSVFISTANNYLRGTLKFGEGKTYHPFGDGVFTKWDFRHKAPGSPIKFQGNVMPDLAAAMTYNPHLKVMLNMGYFDLATPYFEGVYEMHHLPMNPALQKNISYAYYQSGHMVYLHLPSLKKLHDNVAKFIADTH